MRTNTKLKILLATNDLLYKEGDNDEITLTMVNKKNPLRKLTFTGKNNSSLLSQAYSHYSKSEHEQNLY